MNKKTTLLLMGALFCHSMAIQAQEISETTVNAAITDSITYTQENSQFVENLWYEGKIYRSRTVSQGTPISFCWDKPDQPQEKVVFARGVSPEKGWYDVNKKGDGTTGNDAVLCWAACCANMLEWWQERYKERFGELPEKAITGVGKEYELALFELYQRDWKNNHGSEVDYGIPWYLTGEDRTENVQGVARPIAPGGYYTDQWDKISPLIPENYIYCVEAYPTWGDGWDVDPKSEPLEIFTNLVIDAFKYGMASITIQVGYSNMHAITVWGYELDDNGLVSQLYITDSDDMLNRPKEPRVPILHKFGIAKKGRDIGIVGMLDGFNMIARFIPFKAGL